MSNLKYGTIFHQTKRIFQWHAEYDIIIWYKKLPIELSLEAYALPWSPTVENKIALWPAPTALQHTLSGLFIVQYSSNW